jgi:hypothetical protein
VDVEALQSLQSDQGMIWQARSSAGSVMPVNGHRLLRPQGPHCSKRGPTPGSPAGSTDPPPVLIDSSSLRSYPWRVQIRTRVSSGSDILLRTVPRARRGIVHDVRSCLSATKKNPERLGGSQSVGLFPEGVAGRGSLNPRA